MIRKAFPWVIAGCMLGLSGAAYALGLGEIKLHSKLNQPLNAEIRLLSAGNLSEEQIIANLARAEEFERAGVVHNFFLHQLKFQPVFKKNGRAFIKVTTRSPVKEPFLDFLLEVNWPNGRVMREYTLLLDPPVFSRVKLTHAPEAPLSSSQNQARTVSNNHFNEQAVDTRTIDADDWNGFSDGEYRVRDADTLWGIARKNHPANGTIQQTMVAIYQANPEAFLNQNMNELKRGSVLKMPDVASIEALSQQQALLEIARQNQLWGGGSRAGTRPRAVVDTAEYAADSGATKSDNARLKLSSPGTGEDSTSTMKAEAVATLTDENQALKERLNDQAEHIKKLEQMLALKDDELSSIQQNASQDTDQSLDPATAKAAVSESQDVAAASSKTGSEQLDTAADVIKANTDSTKLTESDPATINVNGADENSVVTSDDNKNTIGETTPSPAKKIAPEAAQAVNVAAPQPLEKSFMDKVMGMGMAVWMAIGSGLLVLFFSILWYRRRNMEEDVYQESLIVPVGGELNEDDLPVVGDDILAAEAERERDYIPESEALQEDSLDVESNTDPLGEADVYLAYGKYDQAERILRDALDEEPERTDLRLKLMECFADNKALGEFKEQKRELLEVLATDSAVAEQVNNMEREAWPDEAARDELPSTEDIFGDLSFSGETAADQQAHEDELVFPDDTADQTAGTDEATVSDKNEALELTPSVTEDNSPDFDAQIEEDDLEFTSSDMDFSETREEAREFADSVSEEGVDFISESELMDAEITDDDLDKDSNNDESIDESLLDLGDVDEASTKLDLARAYIDMEDFDGASEILQEVVTEGTDQQKAEAEELLSKMA